MYIEKEEVSDKNAVVTAVLCLLFGLFGTHRFYVGKYISGFIYFIFGSSFIGVIILSKLLGFNGVLISIFLFLLILCAVFYDLHALYTECFLDSKGKVLLSGTRQDELVGRTYDEKFTAKLTVFIAVIIFIAFICTLLFISQI